jgi:putative ABC transport system ATP-binding protein
VFQSFNLIPHLTALENVALPLALAGAGASDRRARAGGLLKKVGLELRMRHRPPELSGGERQRVAIARALANTPRLLLCDEPTGNLDSKTGGEILELLRHAVRDLGQTVVMVTHEARAAAIADRVLFLADGNIVRELSGASAHDVAATMEEISAQ